MIPMNLCTWLFNGPVGASYSFSIALGARDMAKELSRAQTLQSQQLDQMVPCFHRQRTHGPSMPAWTYDEFCEQMVKSCVELVMDKTRNAIYFHSQMPQPRQDPSTKKGFEGIPALYSFFAHDLPKSSESVGRSNVKSAKSADEDGTDSLVVSR